MPTLKIACQGADTLPYTELTEFQGELKSLSKSDFEAMRRQLVENGFSFPIALWVSPEGNNCILDGHQRLRVIRELAKEGWTIPELPVTWVEADNEQQAKEKLLAAAGAFGTVSDQGLYELITSADLDIDRIAEMTRFREIDFDVFKEEYFLETPQPTEGLTDPDDVPENVETRVKPGELWILGNHRLLCGDSTKKEDVDRLMNGEKADMVFTDPPYGVSYEKKTQEIFGQTDRYRKITNDDLKLDDLEVLIRSVFKNIEKILADKSCYYICSPQGGELGLMMMMMMQETGLPCRHMCIWVKNAPVFSMGRLDYDYQHEPILFGWSKNRTHQKSTQSGQWKSSVWKCDREPNKLHPTMKPIALIENALLNSCPANGVVFEPFGGSGSTLIACEKTGNNSRVIEIDPHYCDVIIERWEKFTGKKSVKT